jgi:ParB family chromosome partitioning protein
MTDFKTISLTEIHPDPNQPRKYYDALAMQELIQSVKEKGVLQPILLRPNGNGYILVCGERRYRASKEAGLTDIPAVIRQLTDDEALELQIIENLQRKDVNPMEEGTAFKMLKEKFSIEEIGHRVGKSPQYVAQRIKLCDLIPEFQELLFADRIKLALAFKIARLAEKDQSEMYKDARVPKDWAKKKDWELPSWIRVDEFEHPLDEAPFKTEDPDLYPEMGPCNKCQFNSHFNKLLFPDLQKKRICHNGVCYNIKTNRSSRKVMEDALQDPDMVFIFSGWHPDGDDKKKIKMAEELGAVVLADRDLFEQVEAPEDPGSLEKYMEDFIGNDPEELTEKEKKEAEDDYRDAVADYKNELKEYQEAMASGRLKKAFVVAGHDEGKFTYIKIKAKKGAGKANAAAEAGGGNLDVAMIDSEMSEIQDREKRNKELDREKVYRRLIEHFNLGGNDFLKNEDELGPDEWTALLYSLAENSYKVRDFLSSELKVSGNWYNNIELFNAIYHNQRNEVLHKAFRLFIHDKLINANECDYEMRGKPAAIYNIGKQYFKDELAGYEADQHVKAEKRGKNVQARLDALKAKKKTLQAADKPAKPAKATKSPTSKKAK